MARELTVFEGPDGAGKTTLAKAYAEARGALYIHHGPYVGLTGEQIYLLYEGSMWPALSGSCDVVLDRCWASERPYGLAFRGEDRLTDGQCAALTNIARSCESSFVLCLPRWGTVLANFEARRGAEYLAHADELLQVYGHYDGNLTTMPVDHVHAYDGSSPLTAWSTLERYRTCARVT